MYKLFYDFIINSLWSYWFVQYSESGDEDIEELVEKDMGKVICAEYHDKKKIKNNWFPGLIVSPKAQTAIKINVKKEYVVRSFKDGK